LYLQDLYLTVRDPHRLHVGLDFFIIDRYSLFFVKFIFAAFRHCVPSLRAIRHDKPEKLIATYKNEIMKMFDQV